MWLVWLEYVLYFEELYKVKYLINNFLLNACWNDNILDLLGKYIIKINFPYFYLFNVATRIYNTAYVARIWTSHSIFLDSVVLYYAVIKRSKVDHNVQI